MLLTKGVKWMWNKAQEDAFIEAKEALQSDALLVHFDPNKPLVLLHHMDVVQLSLIKCLMGQNDR